MESTGGSGSVAIKGDKDSKNSLPSDKWKYFPSIHEQGLGDKSQKKKLEGLFSSYLKPHQNESKSLDIQKEWGRQFKEALAGVPKKQIPEEVNFIMDVIIFYLYYDIVTDK